MVRQGMRCITGNGQTINIWKQPWLISKDIDLFHLLYAYEWFQTFNFLIDHETSQWKTHVVESIFNKEDTNAIQEIPLLNTSKNDHIFWKFSPNGVYTIKTAYHSIMDNTNNLKVEGTWMMIWKLHIPPKSKHFMWRPLRECLPTTQQLATKGISCQPHCCFCSQHLENEWHLFVSCTKAQQFWQQVGLWNSIEPYVRAPSLSVTLWSIWKARNQKVWNI